MADQNACPGHKQQYYYKLVKFVTKGKWKKNPVNFKYLQNLSELSATSGVNIAIILIKKLFMYQAHLLL